VERVAKAGALCLFCTKPFGEMSGIGSLRQAFEALKESEHSVSFCIAESAIPPR
jgi:hypothetical protein